MWGLAQLLKVQLCGLYWQYSVGWYWSHNYNSLKFWLYNDPTISRFTFPKDCNWPMRASESADDADAHCCQYIQKLLWIHVLCPHRWTRYIHTTHLMNMDLALRPYGTENNNGQNKTIRYTLTCGDRAVGGWVKSVEWADDRRPCALLTVWRLRGADSTSCWRTDTDKHKCQVGEHHH